MPDIFLYQGEASSQDIKLRDPTVADGGAPPITGTVALDSPASSIAATASLEFIATVNLTSPASSIAATGAELFTGTLALMSPASSIDSTGSLTFTAIAALESPASAIAAAGEVADIIGAAAIESPASATDATGTVESAPVVAGGGDGLAWRRAIYQELLRRQYVQKQNQITGDCVIGSEESSIAAKGTVVNPVERTRPVAIEEDELVSLFVVSGVL